MQISKQIQKYQMYNIFKNLFIAIIIRLMNILIFLKINNLYFSISIMLGKVVIY
jgi:hypothetical protein